MKVKLFETSKIKSDRHAENREEGKQTNKQTMISEKGEIEFFSMLHKQLTQQFFYRTWD